MKRLIGFGFFWFALGMILMMLIENGILAVVLILVSLLISYFLFCK